LEGKADELIRELLAFRIDLMVSNFVPSPAGVSGLYSRRIARTPILICGSSRFRKLKVGFPESISQQPFIMPTVDSKVRHDIDHYLRLSALQVDVIAETQDTAIQKLMGLDGLGLIPAPLVAVEEYLRKRTLFEIGRLEGVSEDLYLISASRRVANPISSALMKGFSLDSPPASARRLK
jgi:LysR family transcriptional activator of nhaA